MAGHGVADHRRDLLNGQRRADRQPDRSASGTGIVPSRAPPGQPMQGPSAGARVIGDRMADPLPDEHDGASMQLFAGDREIGVVAGISLEDIASPPAFHLDVHQASELE